MIKRSLVLCEGADDIHILGYYLFKTLTWARKANKKYFSNNYNFPKDEKVEMYLKENSEDKLALWAVGGKDSFGKAFKFISSINNQHPEEGITQVFLICDRDDDKIEESLDELSENLRKNNINIDKLKNNASNNYEYEIEDKKYNLNIIPVIIPFEENGALETVLMNGIKKIGEDEGFIVIKANNYVDEINKNLKLKEKSKYLNHRRLLLKAKFSSVISIINPEHSTGTINDLLMSFLWEENEEVKKHFNILNEML